MFLRRINLFLTSENEILGRIYIHGKNKKYPGNRFHASVNRGENTLLLNACLATLTIWLCHIAVHFLVIGKMLK